MNSPTILIGFGFADRAGKTTAATYLSSVLDEALPGLYVYNIGDTLRDIAKTMLPSCYDPHSEDFKEQMVTADHSGRQFLRDLASFGNGYLGSDWLFYAAHIPEMLQPDAKNSVLLIADIRTEDQIRAVKKHGGIMIGIDSVRAENVVPQRLYDMCDFVIRNNSGLDEFKGAVLCAALRSTYLLRGLESHRALAETNRAVAAALSEAGCSQLLVENYRCRMVLEALVRAELAALSADRFRQVCRTAATPSPRP